MAFFVFGQPTVNALYFLEFLKLFMVVDMDGSFPMSHSMQHLDSRFMS
jgi:hypothetical protein